MSLKHLMASRVCPRYDFSAICRLALCLQDMLISKHTLTEMLLFARMEGCLPFKCTTPFDSCKNNGSNGSIFSISSEVSNSSTQNVRQIETTRSGKDEANKALQDLASTAKNSHSNLMLHITRPGSSLPGNHQQQRHHRSFPRDSCAYKVTNDGLHPG